mmetsp:Transcript_360/g.753  ORF Transcript_360/g.753 Transcript_360/m.753 type:complete len:210 (-) Transcript_360:580-1209(-)
MLAPRPQAAFPEKGWAGGTAAASLPCTGVLGEAGGQEALSLLDSGESCPPRHWAAGIRRDHRGAASGALLCAACSGAGHELVSAGPRWHAGPRGLWSGEACTLDESVALAPRAADRCTTLHGGSALGARRSGAASLFTGMRAEAKPQRVPRLSSPDAEEVHSELERVLVEGLNSALESSLPEGFKDFSEPRWGSRGALCSSFRLRCPFQ